jgi:oligopeptide/dipeptide ABC transporter ATP-binding protein
MRNIRKELNLTYLIITHNLSTLGYLADRIAVMYLGLLVEVGPTEAVFDAPAHPYTRGLLASVAEPNPRRRISDDPLLPPGEVPSPRNPPPGCRFHTRCPFAQARCREEAPVVEEIAPNHIVACHFWDQLPATEAAVSVNTTQPAHDVKTI